MTSPQGRLSGSFTSIYLYIYHCICYDPIISMANLNHTSRQHARRLPRSAAVIGALLSALAVVYAESLGGAAAAAIVFWIFYRQLGERLRPVENPISTPAPRTKARSHGKAA